MVFSSPIIAHPKGVSVPDFLREQGASGDPIHSILVGFDNDSAARRESGTRGRMLVSSTGKGERMIGLESEIKIGQQFEFATPVDEHYVSM